MEKSGWDAVNWVEVIGSALISLGVGMIKLLLLIRRGRRVKLVDYLLEPSLAVFGGLLAWALSEVANAPDVLQAATTSLGAWAGPRFIHQMERRYLGGSRLVDADSGPVPFDDAEKPRRK